MNPDQTPPVIPRKEFERGCVVVVDHNTLSRDLIRRRLAAVGYRVEVVSTLREFEVHLGVDPPNLVLTDLALPDGSGLEVITHIRDNPRTRRLPVILISSSGDSRGIVEGLRRGANDCVTKPIDFAVLLARMETHLSRAAQILQLETQRDMLAARAANDRLTGVYNRRSLLDALESVLERCRRDDTEAAFLIFGVDDFHAVADRLGQSVSDTVICEIAMRVRRVLAGADILGRYSESEFCVLMPETELARARDVGEWIGQLVSQQPYSVAGVELALTVSVGIAATESTITAERLIGRAERALSAAYGAGGARLVAIELMAPSADERPDSEPSSPTS